MQNNANQLVACFVELSSNKERTTLEQSVAKSLSQLLHCEVNLVQLYDSLGVFSPHIRFFQSEQSNNQSVTAQSGPVDEVTQETIKDYLSQLEFNCAETLFQQQEKIFWPLFSGEHCFDILILERCTINAEELNLLVAVGTIFTNFMNLLDAGERDALTGLYNRRVFDTRLHALILKSASNKNNAIEERRGKKVPLNHFLGVIDIDFFKRVNDNFGHLFGDEVLLWLAQQMRVCFRDEDSLFRYGGEEFVVLLAGLEQQQAGEVFERFRELIATTVFPQVGQVTVSIGYTSIDDQANPTLVFGQADQALYYAKDHGRNRVECYAQLVAGNLLQTDQGSKDIELF